MVPSKKLVVRNPYAKQPVKRQRTNESSSSSICGEATETMGVPITVGNQSFDKPRSVLYVNEPQTSIQTMPKKSVCALENGASLRTVATKCSFPMKRAAPISNPYRKSPDKAAPPSSQRMFSSKPIVTNVSLSQSTHTMQEKASTPCLDSNTQEDVLDTSIDWESAAVELDHACSRTSSFSDVRGQADSRASLTTSSSLSVVETTRSETPASPDQKTAQNGARAGSSILPMMQGPGHLEDPRWMASSSAASLGHGIRPSSWLQAGQTGFPDSQVSTAPPAHKTIFASSTSVDNAAEFLVGGRSIPALPPQLRYSPSSVLPVADEHRPSLIMNADLSATLLNGWKLFPHQKRAVLKGLVMRRVILALDMGLGKTLIGCVWSKSFFKTFSGLRIYVICPVSLKMEWKRTAVEAAGLYATEEEIEDDQPGMQVCSWAKIPTLKSTQKDSRFVVVCDEAHSMQSMQSARTKNVLQLVSSKNCLGVLLLTGTPMKNGKPLNLFPLLKAVRHPFGSNQKAYEIQFCDGKEKSYGRGRPVWDANGASNLPLLRKHISSHLMHMTKEDCLKELPPQTRVVHKIPVSSRHQLKHNNALDDLARLYQNTQSFENSGDVILSAVQRVRQIGSDAKIDGTVSLAKSILEEEPAVVIFTSFVAVAQSVHKKLGEFGWSGELLTGETPPKKRQGMVDNFQAGMSSVFVCTFGAGGVGLTLTAAHTVILLDRPWTPGDASQAEDRVRRIGQTKPVKSIWVVAFDLDEQIDSVLERKSQNASTVLTERGDDATAASESAPKISIFRLLKSILPQS